MMAMAETLNLLDGEQERELEEELEKEREVERLPPATPATPQKARPSPT